MDTVAIDAAELLRRVDPSAAEDDDVIDPYRRSQATYEASAAQLLPGIDEVERIVRAALT